MGGRSQLVSAAAPGKGPGGGLSRNAIMGVEGAARVSVPTVLAQCDPEHGFSDLLAQPTGGCQVIAKAQSPGHRARRLALVFVYLVGFARHPTKPTAFFIFRRLLRQPG